VSAPGLDAVLLQHEVEQFYYAEARMLDERRFFDWLDLFTDDSRYLMPIRRNAEDDEFSDSMGPASLAHFDDDKTVLTKRVMRIGSGMAWTEDPPSIQRHLITNIAPARVPDSELEVHSCFQVHRYTMDRELEIFTGSRLDRLRSTEAGLRIVERTVYLDHTVVLANNLNLFL
jgi:3-phenylpropionate/cinnamic acid dioxygenase small subunit